jgi:hypothetical protein
VFTILSAVAENERDRIRGRRELSRHRAGMGSRVRHREDRGEDHPAHPGAGLTSCIIIIAAADETANGPRLAPTPSVHPPQFVSSCLCHISRGLSPFIRHFLCRKFFRFCRLDQLSVGPAAAGVLWPMAGTDRRHVTATSWHGRPLGSNRHTRGAVNLPTQTDASVMLNVSERSMRNAVTVQIRGTRLFKEFRRHESSWSPVPQKKLNIH